MHATMATGSFSSRGNPSGGFYSSNGWIAIVRAQTIGENTVSILSVFQWKVI